MQEAALTVVPIQARLHVIKCFTGNSYIQSPLGFATLDKAAALALATAKLMETLFPKLSFFKSFKALIKCDKKVVFVFKFLQLTILFVINIKIDQI